MRGCRAFTRRLGSVSQDTGRPRSDPGSPPRAGPWHQDNPPRQSVEGSSHQSARQRGRR
jgi:hypothetical protein